MLEIDTEYFKNYTGNEVVSKQNDEIPDFVLEKEILRTPKQYLKFSNNVLTHIIQSKALNSTEKYCYLMLDYYAGMNKSLKKAADRTVTLTAKQIGIKVGRGKLAILRVQKKLEKMGYFKIYRSRNQNYLSNINVIAPTVPDSVFNKMLTTNNCRGLDNKYDITETCRRTVLDQINLYSPINYKLLSTVFFHKDLSNLTKVLYLKLFQIMHKIKVIYKRSSYFGTLSLQHLHKELGITQTTLCSVLKELEKAKLLKRKRMLVRDNHEDIPLHKLDEHIRKDIDLSNRFDRSTWVFCLTLPEDNNNDGQRKHICYDIPKSNKELSRTSIKNNQSNIINIVQSSKNRGGYRQSLCKKKSNFLKQDNQLDFNKAASLNRKNSDILIANDNQIKEKKDLKKKLDKYKTLIDFYPLCRDDVSLLQLLSGRKFNTHVTNEILRDIAFKLPKRQFRNRRNFINYMSKVLASEMRDAEKVNNISNFKIAKRESLDDKFVYLREKDFMEIENCLESSEENNFKRKIINRLPCKIRAHEFLTKFKQAVVKADGYHLYMHEHMEFTKQEEGMLLHEISNNYFAKKQTKEILKIFSDLKPRRPGKDYLQERKIPIQNLKPGMLKNIRLALIEQHGSIIDCTWFSVLRSSVNYQKKTVILTAHCTFFRDWITNNYLDSIEEAIRIKGFQLLSIESDDGNVDDAEFIYEEFL